MSAWKQKQLEWILAVNSINPYKNLSGMSEEQACKYIEKRLYDSLTQFTEKGPINTVMIKDIKEVLRYHLRQFYAELIDRPRYNIDVKIDGTALLVNITEIDIA